MAKEFVRVLLPSRVTITKSNKKIKDIEEWSDKFSRQNNIYRLLNTTKAY